MKNFEKGVITLYNGMAQDFLTYFDSVSHSFGSHMYRAVGEKHYRSPFNHGYLRVVCFAYGIAKERRK